MEVDWLSSIGHDSALALGFDWPSFIQVAVVLVAVGSMAACLMMLRHQRRIEKRWQNTVRVLVRHLRSLSTAAKQADKRLSSVEVDTMNLVQEQRELEASAPAKDSFRHAIALVERGWKADDLMDACGLTRVEADLVCLLHGAAAKKHNGALREQRN